MTTVVLSLHLIVTAVLIFLILLQKTEGNAAGGGFGGGGVSITSMMQPRTRPNALTRATSVVAIGFFATSIALALLAKDRAPTSSILAPVSSGAAPSVSDSVDVSETPSTPGPEGAAPAVPGPEAPSAAAPAPEVPK